MNTPLSPPAPPPLTSQERSRLRAAAHALNPVVLLGDKGLTDAVLKEIDRALAAHQLIKVRAAAQERDERTKMLADICTQLACHPVHHLGKMLILYRAEPVAEPTSNPLTRKAGAPYVTKKRAALDPTAGDAGAAKKPANAAVKSSPASVGKKSVTGKPRKPATTASRTRGPGSALTLRAGARSTSRSTPRPIARTVGVKKPAARKTSGKTNARSR